MVFGVSGHFSLLSGCGCCRAVEGPPFGFFCCWWWFGGTLEGAGLSLLQLVELCAELTRFLVDLFLDDIFQESRVGGGF